MCLTHENVNVVAILFNILLHIFLLAQQTQKWHQMKFSQVCVSVTLKKKLFQSLKLSEAKLIACFLSQGSQTFSPYGLQGKFFFCSEIDAVHSCLSPIPHSFMPFAYKTIYVGCVWLFVAESTVLYFFDIVKFLFLDFIFYVNFLS